MKLAVVHYNAGNTASVLHALSRLGVEAVLTNDPEELQKASHVVFPGVGEARAAMNSLKETGLDIVIPRLRQPVLGICVGMQLLCRHSEENSTDCLGIIHDRVQRFSPAVGKVPHMGWNRLYALQEPLFRDIPERSFVYFAHSYYVPSGAASIAEARYGQPFAAAVQHDNFFGVQFHPEKSAEVGATLFRNFLSL